MFTEYDLDGNLRNFIDKIQQGIESDREASESDTEEYIQNKIKEYKIDLLVLHPENITVSQREYPIPSNYFPSGYWVDNGQSYPKPVLTFHLPFEGNPQWFKSKPSTFMMWTEEVTIHNNEVIFAIINFSNDVEVVKKERDDFLKKIHQQVENINNSLKEYNSKLENIIKESVKKAKDKFKNQDDLLNKLGNNLR